MSYKEDFLLLVTESLIKAVKSRLDKKPEVVQQALRRGLHPDAVLRRAAAGVRKAGAGDAALLREMVAAIDLGKEDARLSQRGVRPRTRRRAPMKAPAAGAGAAPLTGAAKTLDDAEKLYTARDLEKAKKLFLQALRADRQKPLHAAAYYGLARIAAVAERSGRRPSGSSRRRWNWSPRRR